MRELVLFLLCIGLLLGFIYKMPKAELPKSDDGWGRMEPQRITEEDEDGDGNGDYRMTLR